MCHYPSFCQKLGFYVPAAIVRQMCNVKGSAWLKAAQGGEYHHPVNED
jgi:hypothetical protein